MTAAKSLDYQYYEQPIGSSAWLIGTKPNSCNKYSTVPRVHLRDTHNIKKEKTAKSKIFKYWLASMTADCKLGDKLNNLVEKPADQISFNS